MTGAGGTGLVPGDAVEVAPGVRRILAPNPGLMTGPGTNTYLVGEGRDAAVIDPGPDDDAHLHAILTATGGQVGRVLVTHTHLDHAPLAARVKAATGAEVLGGGRAPERRRAPRPHLHHQAVRWPRREDPLQGHDRQFAPDRQLVDGDTVAAGGFQLRVVHTPGHTSNHLCFDLDGLLFSGDHIMSGSTVVIAPPDGDMEDYIESLRRVRRDAPRRIAPGHGAMIDQPAPVIDYYLSHRRSREREVVAALVAAGPEGSSAADLVAVVYHDVKPELHPVARYSVWAHLRKLGSQGLAVTEDRDALDASWWSPSLAPPSARHGR